MFAMATATQAATITHWQSNGRFQNLTVALDDLGDTAKVRRVIKSGGKAVAQKETKIKGVDQITFFILPTKNLTASCKELPWWDSWLD